MKLLSISISGFRNIAETHIELGGITAFVSPNNYGKSNLLEAMGFAAVFLNESPRMRTIMMGRASDIPLIPGLEDSRFSFQIEFEEPSLGEYRFVRYGFSFEWKRDDGTGQRIVDETIETNSKRDRRWTNYLKREKGQYKKSHDTRSFRTIKLDDNQLAIDVLTAIEDIDINPVIKRIKDFGFAICNSLDVTGRFRSVPLEFGFDADDDGLAAFDDIDVSRAMYRLKTNRPQRYEDLLSALYTLFPEFEDIAVNSYELKQEEKEKYSETLKVQDAGESENGEQTIPFHIRDELYKTTVRSAHLNQPVNMSLMSMGTQRIVWLLTNVIIADTYDAQCIGIEELETSIHPRMLGELLEILDENMENTSLLITSHSPFLIQYLKPEQIYLGVPGESGTASFKRLRRETIGQTVNRAHDNGLGFGEYLFNLMSSEEDGAAALREILEG